MRGNKVRKVMGGQRKREDNFAMDVFGAINLNPYAFSGESPSWSRKEHSSAVHHRYADLWQ